MTAPSQDPSPQWEPQSYAHAKNSPDRTSNIPSMGFYKIPSNQPGGVPAPAQLQAQGYFGSHQHRPSMNDESSTGGTKSENQGNPSLSAILPFGSVIFWASAVADPIKASGMVARVNLTPAVGYGKKPGMTIFNTAFHNW